MKETREARSFEGPSGDHTGSDITLPTKFLASAFEVGRDDARMILGFMTFLLFLWLRRVESFRFGHGDDERLDRIERRRRHTGTACEGDGRAHDRLDLHGPAEIIVLKDRRAMVEIDALGSVADVRAVVEIHAVRGSDSQRLGMG